MYVSQSTRANNLKKPEFLSFQERARELLIISLSQDIETLGSFTSRADKIISRIETILEICIYKECGV